MHRIRKDGDHVSSGNEQVHDRPAQDAASDTSPAVTTPYLMLDTAYVGDACRRILKALPVADVHYAVKCNPAPGVLAAVADAGGSFEISSMPELDMLIELGIDPQDVLFSHPVKRSTDIRAAHAAGVTTFAFDCASEVDKLAECAPGSSVYLRIGAPPLASQVASEGKFGADPDEAVALLRRAVTAGLDPYGVGFHVGSQMTDVRAWGHGIARARDVIDNARKEGIRLRLMDIGGGFPARYSEPVPDIETIGEHIKDALVRLPDDLKVVAEPGRYLLAEAGVMVTKVIGVADRRGRRSVHIDAGAFHGLIEALETRGQLRYPVTDSRQEERKVDCRLTGPSCDSQDDILHGVPLSAGLREGDLVYIHSAGAYSWSYTRDFNGFSAPTVRIGPLPGQRGPR
jgi:ornithine decarboxylase